MFVSWRCVDMLDTFTITVERIYVPVNKKVTPVCLGRNELAPIIWCRVWSFTQWLRLLPLSRWPCYETALAVHPKWPVPVYRCPTESSCSHTRFTCSLQLLVDEHVKWVGQYNQPNGMCDLFLKRIWFGKTLDQIGDTFLENQLSNKEYLSLNGMLSLVLVVTAKTLGMSFLVKPMPCWGMSSLFDIRGLMKELCHLVHKCRFCYSLSCLLVKMRCTHVLFLSPLSILGCVQSCGLFSGRRHGPTPRMWPSPSRLWWERWATTWSGLSGVPLRPERRRASWSWGRSGSCRN